LNQLPDFELVLRFEEADLHGAPNTSSRRDPYVALGVDADPDAEMVVDEQLHDRPGADRAKLVDEASRRFDLTPLDEDFLFRHLAERPKGPAA